MRFAQFFRSRWLLLGILSCLSAGCSSYDKWKEGRPKTYYTSGTVMFDGKPVEGATVTFQPTDEEKGKPGLAITDEDGFFEAQTFDPRDGLTEGTHRVAIRKTRMLDKATKKEVKEVTSDAPLIEDHLVPKKYSEFTSSKIEIQIKSGKNKLEPFNLAN